jgi:mono/diheme cytochrome c family protein
MRVELLALAALLLLAACPPKNEDPAVARGRQAYLGTCIACHNMNPALDGAIGPAIAGSSRELIEARVLRAEYPPGYKPKRETKAMPAQPQMAAQIDDLTAFLNAK